MSDDEKISRRYRELGAEEPPRALDDAILAAARRRPQRWYAPLAAAAVLVLAVAVTLQMQVEQPGIESPVQKAASPRADQPALATSPPVAQAELKLKVEAQLRSTTKQAVKEKADTQRKEAGQPAPAAPAAREPQPFAADRAAESSVTGALARRMEERTSRDAAAAALTPRLGPIQAQAQRAARAEAQERQQEAKPADTPERELERIAALRGQGGQDEADRALAEFRKRYPDYRISEEMRLRVERR
jgi:hypothetical protein